MDDDNRPVAQYVITGIDFFGFEETNALKIILNVSGAHDIALEIPPEIALLIESKLSKVSEMLAARSKLQ